MAGTPSSEEETDNLTRNMKKVKMSGVETSINGGGLEERSRAILMR